MRRKIFTTLALIATMLSSFSLTAYANEWEGNPYAAYDVTTDANKVKSGDDLTALQVTFNGKPWYIIADNSTAVDAGTVTLLAADTSFGLSEFSSDDNNDYSNSTVKAMLDALTAPGGSFAGVAYAIVTNADAGGKLYLLSIDEAENLIVVSQIDEDASNMLKMNFSSNGGCWWLRSPGMNVRLAAIVYGGYGFVDGGGSNVYKEFGVRPALQLDLSKVTFDTETKTFEVLPIDPDQVAADSVVALIDSLPAEVAATDEAAIAAARAAYDALTDAQKAKVPAEKLTKLTDAEAALAAAKQAAADQAAADAVVALIDAIPADVTVAAEPAIAAARAAYDALTEAQKALVPAEKLAKLTDAEAAGATKEPTGIDETAADAVESNIWYDLNGRRLNGKPTKSGIYINNHQKVYVK